ncbi:hypothetical protein ILUMI_19262 [Ignelater luminosus]|uniref:HTH CENPB-type domain-containing protein n=1 Tax=Ignelater luminosus TaxID=2038154 RepID=A0A8K0CJN2_IGNLU|nr:hypothetical protein ILUMI_19262 [Ignelater luminosus]
MPKSLPGEKYKKKYSDEDLKNALDAVRRFGVPRPTLQFRLCENFTKAEDGSPSVLKCAEEKQIVNWVIDCQGKGFPRRKEDTIWSVKQFFEKNSWPNSFKDNCSGEG